MSSVMYRGSALMMGPRREVGTAPTLSIHIGDSLAATPPAPARAAASPGHAAMHDMHCQHYIRQATVVTPGWVPDWR